MTTTQKIALRISEVRQRLNEISGFEGDALTPEIRAESEKLTNEYGGLETRHRAAIIADGETETRAANDGEGREIRQLVEKASLGVYLSGAAREVDADGAERELRAALNLQGDQIPLDVLLSPDVEKRADVATNVTASIAETQSSIAGRIFAESSGAYLGIDRPTVPVGDSTYVALTGGAAADFRSASRAKDAEIATFSTKTVSPSRVTARYLFGVESTVKLAGLEAALRADLAATISDKLDAVSLTGQATVANTSPAVEGLISQLTLPTLTPGSGVATWSDYSGVYSSRVDGKYSTDGSNVRLMLNPETFRHLSLLQINTSGDLLTEVLPAGRFRASANMPETPAADHIATGITYAAGARRGFVQPVWRALTVIRDPYSNAESGQVALTAVVLTGAAMVNASPYALHAFRLRV